MMADLVFNEDMELYLHIKEQKNEVCLSLSDGLLAYDEPLTDEYKQKICDFISQSSNWFEKALQAVLKRGQEKYGIEELQAETPRLMNIYILFEQVEKPLFGLEFRAELDIEHGCGLKMDGNTFEITEVGAGDIAFC